MQQLITSKSLEERENALINNVSEQIKTKMKEKNISSYRLARLAELGSTTTDRTIKRNSNTTLRTLARIALVLDIDIFIG